VGFNLLFFTVSGNEEVELDIKRSLSLEVFARNDVPELLRCPDRGRGSSDVLQ
jgi:hypothetical protein